MEANSKPETDANQCSDGVVQSEKQNGGLEPRFPSKTRSIWNSSKKEFLGRTWDSWVKIGIFYMIFYSCLAAFFAIMLVGFFHTIDVKHPTQQNMYSLIKANPGMGFRPMPNIESTLIKFQQGNPSSYSKYVKNVDKYLKHYYNQTGDNVVECNDTTDGVELASQDKVCRVGRSMFGEHCTSDRDYSFDEGTPCVMLKINKVYGWVPRSFNKTELQDTNNTLAQDAKKKLGDRLDPNYIGVSCEGENEADSDYMGQVRYFPEKGFPISFYPYKNQKHYRVPVVYVKFDGPKYGALIQVWCRVWASNIKHHKNDKAGSIHFELLIE